MILHYIIKTALVLAMLYVCIMPLLEKETFHRLNRIIILGCLILSFAVPLIHITSGTNPTVAMVRQAVQLPEIMIDGNGSKQPTWNLADIITCIYTIGVVAIFFITVVQTAYLIQRLRKCEHIADNRGNTIVLTDYAISPFCFFHYIVMSRDDYANNRGFILTHEQEHIRLHHYIDLVVLQVATIIQWFNPFVWLIGKNLKTIHEFEVDEAVLNKGIDAKAANTTANSISTNNMQTKQSDKKIFRVVEVMPQFKGGDAKLMEFLMMNMKYPESAIKAKQQGRAVVGFVVGKDGTVSDVHIEKSTGYDVLDNEAMRVVKSMPAWEPGKQKGKPVDVKYFVPITFRQK